MIGSHDFDIHLASTGPKTGLLTAPWDDLTEIEVASPPEFGGPGGMWSPEHLLVASIASCLMTTFHAIAAGSGIEVLEYSDMSTGHLERGDDGLYRIDTVTLRPTVVISGDSRPDRAERLLQKAERVCLIARSVSARVELVGRIVVAHQVGT